MWRVHKNSGNTSNSRPTYVISAVLLFRAAFMYQGGYQNPSQGSGTLLYLVFRVCLPFWGDWRDLLSTKRITKCIRWWHQIHEKTRTEVLAESSGLTESQSWNVCLRKVWNEVNAHRGCVHHTCGSLMIDLRNASKRSNSLVRQGIVLVRFS